MERCQMDLSGQKEQFGQAYVRAVAAVAGYAVARPEVDDDSVDLCISSKAHAVRPKLDIQLKCSQTIELADTDTVIRFALKQKNYDDLRIDVLVPRILVVVRVPEELGQWLHQDEEKLLMRRCGYWLSLAGLPMTQNETSTTIHIPRSNWFTADALGEMMSRIASGGRI
jgi:hypothetical protein